MAAWLMAMAAAFPADPAWPQGAPGAQTAPTGAVSRPIWRAMRPTLRIRDGAGPIGQLAVAADGGALAMISADGAVRVWDLETGRQIRRLPVESVTAFDVGAIPNPAPEKFRGAAGVRAVVTGAEDGTVILYDAVAGAPIRGVRDQGAVLAARLAPGGAVLATAGSARVVSLWDTASGRKIGELKGHTGSVTALAFSASGRLLASGGADGSVRLWSVPGVAGVAALTGGGKITAVAFGGDERVVAGDDGGRVRMWTAAGVATGSWVAESGPITGLGANRIGTVVTAAGTGEAPGEAPGEAHVWSAAGRALGRIGDPTDRVTLATFSPDGTRVITAGSRGLVRLWDGSGGRFLAQLIPTGGGWAVTDATGRFDGSEDGIGDLSWVADEGTFAIANFSEPYYERGLLAKILRAPGTLLTAGVPPVEAGVGVPPSVTLAVTGPTTITVTARDQGGGIDRVRLFQNGTAVDTAKIAADSGPGPTRVITYAVELGAGATLLRAVATSSERIEGQPASLTVRGAGHE